MKLQYPNMASAVEADLRQLRLIFAVYGRMDPAIDTRHIHAEIAARLIVSPSTVKSHVSNILSKLGVASRTEAVTLALRSGILS